MQKIAFGIVFALLYSVSVYAADATTTHAEEALKHTGQASGNASASAAHSIAATGQVTSAVSAVPLKISGAVGAVSNKAGDALIDAANTPIGKPLVVTDETISAGPPPSEAIKAKKQ